MAELRSVDPRTLKPNPNNPRRTPAPKVMDEQLVASLKAIGMLQPPTVTENDGELVIKAGDRRVKAAIDAEFAAINVIISNCGESQTPMESLSENLIRSPMCSVDVWRGIEALEAKGWNEQAIADALALPVRTIKRLKLLAHLLPAMLDCMAAGSMPNEDQLRTIAAASREEQTQVWKKHKPKKGQAVTWHEVARALSKRRIPFAAAKFDADLARAYGVIWQDDLFAPAGEDGRYTTNVDGFFGAQLEWLQNNLPERGILLPTDEYGRGVLPKKVEHVYGTPGKTDMIGHYLDPHTGDVKTIAYRMSDPKKARSGKPGAAADTPPVKTKPEITQKGSAMIGDLRTGALHQALKEAPIDDATLLSLLVLTLGGKNIAVHRGTDVGPADRDRICAAITEGGVLTADQDTVRTAARAMLTIALSCRDNMSNSGTVARIAGDAIDASRYLPNMATEAFLSCLSKTAIGKAATAERVSVAIRSKDTRAALVERFKNSVYIYPAAHFKLSSEEVAGDVKSRRSVVMNRWSDPDEDAAGDGNHDEPGAGRDDEADSFETGPSDNDASETTAAAD